jgi:hypothetical protein
MNGGYIIVDELEPSTNSTAICYTNGCQLQYCTPDDGYSRCPKHVEILK